MSSCVFWEFETLSNGGSNSISTYFASSRKWKIWKIWKNSLVRHNIHFTTYISINVLVWLIFYPTLTITCIVLKAVTCFIYLFFYFFIFSIVLSNYQLYYFSLWAIVKFKSKCPLSVRERFAHIDKGCFSFLLFPWHKSHEKGSLGVSRKLKKDLSVTYAWSERMGEQLRDEMYTYIRCTFVRKHRTKARGMELIAPVSRARVRGPSCILYTLTRIYSALVPKRGTRSYRPDLDTRIRIFNV